MAAPAADREEGAVGFTPIARFAGRHEWLVLITVWLLSALYVGACLKTGWIPWDAGSLGQAAERVLQGQAPFRDFVDPYSGGLAYLNAFAFRLFGATLLSIRIPLLVLFLGWVPVVYFIARRFAGPLSAGLTTLLAVAWSLPNYTEAMPSWYNLFFATFGAAALLRYIETPRQRWLWIAGLCGGLSIVVKITGLYFIAAALLFFAFREQTVTAQTAPASTRRGLFYRPFAIACLILFLAVLLKFVWEQPGLAGLVHFVLPGVCLAALVLWREYRGTPGADRARFQSLFSMALPFLAGAAIPVGILLVWYARVGALRDFKATVALDIARQVQWQSLAPVSPLLFAGLVPAILVFLGACSQRESGWRFADRAAPVVFAALLLAAWKSLYVYARVGLSASLVTPLLAVAALAWLRPSRAVPEARSEEIFLVVSVAVLCALIQFPLAVAIYFCYAAPLAILAVLSLASLRRRAAGGGLAMGALAAFYLVFAPISAAATLPTPGFFLIQLGVPPDLKIQTLPFASAGGIRVLPGQAQEYARVIPLVQAHARGRFIYAAPDCPEVYFLSGFRNPTPTLYDFLDPDFLDVPARTERILRAIRDHGVHVVVLEDGWTPSGALPAALRAALDTDFPQSARADQFEVRWKP